MRRHRFVHRSRGRLPVSSAAGASTAPPVSSSRWTVVRLGAYFAVLAIVPLTITVWTLSRSAEGRQRNEVDSRLAFVLRSGQVELAALAGEATSRATALAGSPRVQQALLRHDKTALTRIAAGTPRVAFTAGTTLSVGSTPLAALRRSAVVIGPKGAVGKVTVSVSLDSALVARLGRGVAPSSAIDLAIVRDGAVIAGAEYGSRIVAQGHDAVIGDRRFRVASATLVSGPGRAGLVALAPESAIAGPVHRYRQWLYLAAAITLAALLLLARTLGQPISHSIRELARVARQADCDELTGLANRRCFNSSLQTELSRARRQTTPLAVMIVDLDNFKRVNDTYGHHGGDAALTAFADVLRHETRDIDVPARYGGEEFAVILPATGTASAHAVAERIRLALQGREIVSGNQRFSVTASFGIASALAPEDGAALVAQADAALYRAKASGKNWVES